MWSEMSMADGGGVMYSWRFVGVKGLAYLNCMLAKNEIYLLN